MSVETETQSQTASEERWTEPPQKTRRMNPLVIGLVLIVLLAAGVGCYFYSLGFEDTDDAQVDGHLNPVASRIDGTVKAVYADDNRGADGQDSGRTRPQ